MTITEGLKKLKLIEKKFLKNRELIYKYAAISSTEKPYFDNEKEQEKQVESLIQSNIDLAGEYSKLKQDIDKTNLATEIEIMWKKDSIAWFILQKRKLLEQVKATYEQLNDDNIKRRGAVATVDWVQPTIIRFYDEKDKNEKINAIVELQSEIDWQLEVINATTEIL